jgi:hypothetical protein
MQAHSYHGATCHATLAGSRALAREKLKGKKKKKKEETTCRELQRLA